MKRAALLLCLFPGVGHEIAPAMRQELARRVQAALPTLQ